MRTKPGTHKNFNFRIPETKRYKANRNMFFFSHEEQVKCKDWRLLSLQGADFRGKMEEKAVEGNCKKEVREIVKEQESRHP